MGKSFRKTLGIFNYKIGNKTHKKPGVIPYHIKKSLLETDTDRSRRLINLMERDSYYPFGKFTRKSKFMFDPKKVPIYNVPDLTGFELKPYASVHTPRIEEELKEKIRKLNDFRDPINLARKISSEMTEKELKKQV